MQTLDLSTSLEPVINISEKTTEQAFAEACGYPFTRVLIEGLEPYTGPISIPVNIIDGLEEIMDRREVSKKQAFLVSKLFALLHTSPTLHA